jgi:hypothetical protein
MSEIPGTRAIVRMARALLLLVLLVSACNYQTIGGGGTMPVPATARPGSKSLPTTAKPKPPALAQQQPTAPGPDTIQCRLSDLTPTATWNVTDQGLAGAVTLANYWPTTCALVGQPLLGLTDDNGQDYPLKVTAPTPSPNPPFFEFKENTIGEIRFSWSNWCGPLPKGNMRVTVTMAKQTEPALYVVVEDQNGNPLNNPPPCIDQAHPTSILTVQDLRLLN